MQNPGAGRPLLTFITVWIKCMEIPIRLIQDRRFLFEIALYWDQDQDFENTNTNVFDHDFKSFFYFIFINM